MGSVIGIAQSYARSARHLQRRAIIVRLRPENVIGGRTPPWRVSAARVNLTYNEDGPRQDAAAGPVIAPPFKGTDPSRSFARDMRSPLRGRGRIRFGLPPCRLPLLPGR